MEDPARRAGENLMDYFEKAMPGEWWCGVCKRGHAFNTACPDSGQIVEGVPEPGQPYLPEPCQPIGCDNGYHIPGCYFEAIDNDPGPWFDDSHLV